MSDPCISYFRAWEGRHLSRWHQPDKQECQWWCGWWCWQWSWWRTDHNVNVMMDHLWWCPSFSVMSYFKPKWQLHNNSISTFSCCYCNLKHIELMREIQASLKRLCHCQKLLVHCVVIYPSVSLSQIWNYGIVSFAPSIHSTLAQCIISSKGDS